MAWVLFKTPAAAAAAEAKYHRSHFNRVEKVFFAQVVAKNKSPFGEPSKPDRVLSYSAFIRAAALESKSSTLLIKGLPQSTA
jgi:hypothetical protein